MCVMKYPDIAGGTGGTGEIALEENARVEAALAAGFPIPQPDSGPFTTGETGHMVRFKLKIKNSGGGGGS